MFDKEKRKNMHRSPKPVLLLGIIAFLIVLGIALFLTVSRSEKILEATPTPLCFWAWGYDEIPPDELDLLHTLIKEAGYTDYRFSGSAYGEDKVCQVGLETISSDFYLMDISFTVSFPVEADVLNQPSIMGAYVRDILEGLHQNIDRLSKIKTVEVRFIHDEITHLWSSTFSEFPADIVSDLSDEDLYQQGVMD